MRTRLAATVGTAALVASLAAVPAATAAAPTGLIISEYVEGSSYNKALEFFNGTDTPIDVADHSVEVYFNGNSSSTAGIDGMSGTIDPGQAYVIAVAQADQALLDRADHVASNSNLWNGDDAIVLRRGDVVVDSFGQVGVDPGSQWGSGDTGAQNATLRRMASVCTGDTTLDDAFDPANEWEGFSQDTFDGLGSHALDCDGGSEPPPPPTCDATDITLISDVQGDGDTSPLTGDPVYVPGDPVTVRAVVTLVLPEYGGYFVQEEPADHDGDPATSEGVFVAGSAPAELAVGDTVEVTGGASEEFDRTQVNATETAVCDVDSVSIDPTPLALPATTPERERVEGMLVETTEDLYVTGLYTAYSFGELGVAPDGPLTQPTSQYAPDDPRARQLLDAQADSLLFIDDRDEYGYDNAPWFHDVRRRAGDLVAAGTAGVLNYSFGDFLLEPVGEFPEIVQVEPRPDAPSLDGGNDLGAFNVLNYFNTFGDSSVLRGARNQAQFDLQSAKIVEAITALDPTVLGIIEVENDYEDHYDGDPTTVASMQTLVEQLNAKAGAGTYDWVVPDEDDLVSEGLGGGGLGTDAIAVGIIYQPDRATEVGDPATFDIDAQLQGEDTDKNRWPLAQSFAIDGQVVTMVVNHLKSKGSSCEDVDGPDFDPGDDVESDLTGNCDLTRTYAAQQLLDWVRTKPTGVRSPDTFIVGDLNSYEEEAPVEVFLDAGYEDAIQTLGGDASTYKFDGRYGRLDHVLASPSAKRLLEDAAVWQANSPEPYGYLYYLDPVETVETATAYASSDHDPVMVSIDSPGRSTPRGRR